MDFKDDYVYIQIIFCKHLKTAHGMKIIRIVQREIRLDGNMPTIARGGFQKALCFVKGNRLHSRDENSRKTKSNTLKGQKLGYFDPHGTAKSIHCYKFISKSL